MKRNCIKGSSIKKLENPSFRGRKGGGINVTTKYNVKSENNQTLQKGSTKISILTKYVPLNFPPHSIISLATIILLEIPIYLNLTSH